jgi:hypothetical protein
MPRRGSDAHRRGAAGRADVEAPEVFDITDAGLWDGRPSLGGVWVAHPDATDPERVMIRNTETGSFVIGALFRRERENPGPGSRSPPTPPLRSTSSQARRRSCR